MKREAKSLHVSTADFLGGDRQQGFAAQSKAPGMVRQRPLGVIPRLGKVAYDRSLHLWIDGKTAALSHGHGLTDQMLLPVGEQ